ncbi:MAG: hypothetical protein PHU81_08785 [Acidobacteriota bacterium]|nr:hypothetical protein [Acidobacteriota bacterium]
MVGENHSGWNIIINLASQPRRNLRAFRFLAIISGSLTILLLILLVVFNIRSFSLYRGIAAANRNLVEEKAALSSQNDQLSRQAANLKQQLKAGVDEVNTLLARKNFSWTIFFNQLEESLPAGAYIMDLDPGQREGRFEFRTKIGLTSRADLSQLVKNLDSQGFKRIKILSESLHTGQFQVEMDFQHAETK